MDPLAASTILTWATIIVVAAISIALYRAKRPWEENIPRWLQLPALGIVLLASIGSFFLVYITCLKIGIVDTPIGIIVTYSAIFIGGTFSGLIILELIKRGNALPE